MPAPLDTVVYADDATASAYWLDGRAIVASPLLADGTFDGEGSAPGFGRGMADDRAAHVKRIQAALHRVAGEPDAAAAADREAVFYDGCADRNEAACLDGFVREMGGVKHPVELGRIVRMTVQPGANRVQVAAVG